ncbi:MAG TPA: hypothetical protein VF188_04080 [Longimicrobiales bacterium]
MSRPIAWFAALPTSDLVFCGLLMFGTHLALMLINQVALFRQLYPSVPVALRPGVSWGMYGAAVVNVLMEVLVFLAGWVWLAGSSVLLAGRDVARPLFGWLGLAYAPVIVYSLVMSVVLLMSDGSAFAGLAAASTPRELVDATRVAMARGPVSIMGDVRWAAYAVTASLAVEAMHRVSAVPRIRAVGAVGTFILLLITVGHLVGDVGGS